MFSHSEAHQRLFLKHKIICYAKESTLCIQYCIGHGNIWDLSSTHNRTVNRRQSTYFQEDDELLLLRLPQDAALQVLEDGDTHVDLIVLAQQDARAHVVTDLVPVEVVPEALPDPVLTDLPNQSTPIYQMGTRDRKLLPMTKKLCSSRPLKYEFLAGAAKANRKTSKVCTHLRW